MIQKEMKTRSPRRQQNHRCLEPFFKKLLGGLRRWNVCWLLRPHGRRLGKVLRLQLLNLGVHMVCSIETCSTASPPRIITAGCGWVQREGGPVEVIRPDDVVWFSPAEKHWHGATATTGMTHIAIQEALDGKVVDWMEKVSDEQYQAGTAKG